MPPAFLWTHPDLSLVTYKIQSVVLALSWRRPFLAWTLITLTWGTHTSPGTRVNTSSSLKSHYSDIIMGTMASQITSRTIIYSTVYLGTDQRKHQSSASMAFVSGIHRWPVNSPHRWTGTRKMFPFDDVIMWELWWYRRHDNIYQKRDLVS